jgi:ribulose-5-phosphate 4-epimerase/fuculose-1-phosphate aldolase
MTMTDEQQIRIDLAATFRIVAKLGMHEAVANHFSAAVSPDGRKFLLNPKWKHFSTIKASDLILLDADDTAAKSRPDVDSTAWAIHGQLHKLAPHIRVAIHLHPIYATYGGLADTESEGARLIGLLGNKSRLMMGNHGVMVTSGTIGEAFDDIYTMERACQVLVNAYATGQPLSVLSDEVAEKTARDWEGIANFSIAHFEEMKRILDKEDPSYAH